MDVMENVSNVKRLIDANKLIDFIDVGHQRHPGELCYSEVDVANILLHAPTVDAVEVVRCRDCKHAWIHPCGYVYCHRDGRNAYEMTFNLDSFCSYGERKKVMDYG